MRTPDMLARLTQIDAEIADVERRILFKNKTIVSALQKGTDTVSQEKQVGLLNKVLQVKKGCRRKLMAENPFFGEALPRGRAR